MIPKLTKEQFRQVYDKGIDATFALFDALQQAVENLEQRVAHLEGILAKDSHNSSKPPSTNGVESRAFSAHRSHAFIVSIA
jgi:hypothetical protein